MTDDGVMPRRLVDNFRAVNVYALVAMLATVVLVLSVCIAVGMWPLAAVSFGLESLLVYRATKSMEEFGYIVPRKETQE